MKITHRAIRSGFDYNTCLVSPCIATNADQSQSLITIMRLDLTGSDVFDGSNLMSSHDGGNTWTDPEPIPPCMRTPNDFGGTRTLSAIPFWHTKSQGMMLFGWVVNYTPDNKVDHTHPRPFRFSRMNPQTNAWSEPIEVVIPEELRNNITQCAAQIVECDNGDCLVPVALSNQPNMLYGVTTVRLRIEETEAHVVEAGNTLNQVRQPRGLYEPALIRFRNRFFLSMRNDITGYVSASDDGLHFDNPQPLCFDDGELLGNYNTQTRWIRHGDRTLYLIYTRRNADNDNVFRHRGPLMIAEVNPETLRVLRATEQILIPNRGARMGNFHACQLSDTRAWVTVAEWMQNDTKGYGRKGAEYCASFGSDNSVFLADITWEKD